VGDWLQASYMARKGVARYGFDQYEAYFLLTQAGPVRLGNVVDPEYTLGASI
jgi:amidase